MLQLLFDLQLLRAALAGGRPVEAGRGTASQQRCDGAGLQGKQLLVSHFELQLAVNLAPRRQSCSAENQQQVARSAEQPEQTIAMAAERQAGSCRSQDPRRAPAHAEPLLHLRNCTGQLRQCSECQDAGKGRRRRRRWQSESGSGQNWRRRCTHGWTPLTGQFLSFGCVKNDVTL